MPPSSPLGRPARSPATAGRPGLPGGLLAIDGVDLDLAAGRRVALVGPSGAGKSTVAAVLLRFCDLAGGTATLGGDLASYRPADVRTVISGCTQDPHLANATIADSVRLARPTASQAELDEAAARARLLPWISSLPQGWDTMVEPTGTSSPVWAAARAQEPAG